MKEIKAIVLKCVMEGQGVAQTDGKEQKFALLKTVGYPVKSIHDNNIFSKKVFTEVDGGKLKATVKISADGIRHAIHIGEHPSHSPNIALHERLKVLFQSNLGTHQRGYLITDTGEVRKSCYSVTDFLEDTGAAPVLELHTCAGMKESSEEDEDSGTSLFFRESLGETSYKGQIVIEPETARTISMSMLQGRLALVESSEASFRENLGKQLGSKIPPSAFYINEESAYHIPEQMIRLTDEQTTLIINNLIEKIASVFISKSQSGYAKMVSIQAKEVIDPLVDYGEDRGWISLASGGVLDREALKTFLSDMSYQNSFTEMPPEKANELLEEYDAQVKEAKALKAKTKKDKKVKAKAAKSQSDS